MSLTLLTGNNSNVLIFAGLLNGLDKFNGDADPYVNDATGTAQLLDSDGNDAGFTKPAFSYIAGSNGNYYAQPSDWVITAGQTYKIRVQLAAGTGEKLDGTYSVTAEQRTT